MRQRLTEICLASYRDFMGKSGPIHGLTEEEADLIAHPLTYQMWHHSFDPHTQVPKLEMADLKPPPAMIKSQTVNEVLGKSSMPALVASALTKA